MRDTDTTILNLRECVETFVQQRDWEQFHNAKDLASANAIEAAELMELFLWKGPAEIEAVTQDVNCKHGMVDELSDVVILCLSMANRLEVDIASALTDKVKANEAKYPVGLVRGKADKYTSYVSNHLESTTN